MTGRRYLYWCVGILAVIGAVNWVDRNVTVGTPVSEEERALKALMEEDERKAPAKKKAALESVRFTYRPVRGGFGNVLLIDAKFENRGDATVKDFQITCTQSGPSGTLLGAVQATVYEGVAAGKSKSVQEFNMGLINSQARLFDCRITDLYVF